MCHLQYASLTPGKFAWKQDCYCSDILVFLLFILTGRGMLTTLPSLHTQALIRTKKKIKKLKGVLNATSLQFQLTFLKSLF